MKTHSGLVEFDKHLGLYGKDASIEVDDLKTMWYLKGFNNRITFGADWIPQLGPHNSVIRSKINELELPDMDDAQWAMFTNDILMSIVIHECRHAKHDNHHMSDRDAANAAEVLGYQSAIDYLKSLLDMAPEYQEPPTPNALRRQVLLHNELLSKIRDGYKK